MVHENYESLYEYIPRDVLPDEYGGTAGSIEKFEGNTKWLVQYDWSNNLNNPFTRRRSHWIYERRRRMV